MKFVPTLVIAAAATLAVMSSGYAKDCGSRPPKISIPNGSTATDDEMKAAQAKLKPYNAAMSTYLHCLSDEIKASTDDYNSVTGEWTKQAENFKNTPAKQ